MNLSVDIGSGNGVCRFPEAVQYFPVHPVDFIVAHRRALPAIFVAKFCHISDFNV